MQATGETIMSKTIFVTGSTDGIGFATARSLLERGHRVILHGRNPVKLEETIQNLSRLANDRVEGHLADLSDLKAVAELASLIVGAHCRIDVLVNNAGVLRTANTATPCGVDVRFVVNAIAPFLLVQRLRGVLAVDSRVVNVSSAAQSPVDLAALSGQRPLADAMQAYAQSKLALTMWTAELAASQGTLGPAFIAVNPGSMLGTKMVKEGFGVEGADIDTGARILCRAALDADFADASGKYYDNDSRQFSAAHADVQNPAMRRRVVAAIQTVIDAALKS